MNSTSIPAGGRQRAVIEAVRPSLDDGRFAVKRCIGERVRVEADAFCDGADPVLCLLRWRHDDEGEWQHRLMQEGTLADCWHGEFVVERVGFYHYSVLAWVDHFRAWRRQLEGRVDADDILLALRGGAEIVAGAAARATGAKAAHDRRTLLAAADILATERDASSGRLFGLAPVLAEAVSRYPDLGGAIAYDRDLKVWVDRVRARTGAWYEMFPRSCLDEGEAHGTFSSCEKRLPYVAAMGFDVLYLPPIHPIGTTNRKGGNNALVAGPADPGSPWAIGSEHGGHTAIDARLGSIGDFHRLMAKASAFGIELALDIAFQCSPDHPWVAEHPDWFRHRADGSVQYAENPPKKYQDIYPLDFESADWRALWMELKGVFEFWINEGVAIFRVDNPHTKSFAFWEWLIAELRREHPQVILLAEAFTRPRLMQRLAKIGFAQSYTYFAWRNSRHELMSYFNELTGRQLREYFRPNLWPNTPDILTEYLQSGGRTGFMIRFTLAATLGASYGIYGPAFEQMVAVPREPGSEEYLDSEKYAVHAWDVERPDSLADFIARVNRIRRQHPALQQQLDLEFYACENDQLLCYGKTSEDGSDTIVVVVSLDPRNVQSGWVSLPLGQLGLGGDQSYPMHDLLTDTPYVWRGERNFVSLDPQMPAHVFRLQRGNRY